MRLCALVFALLAHQCIAAVDMTLVNHRPVEPNLFGLNSILGTIYPLSFEDPILLDVIETLRVGGWRYPGGTVANYWDITQGNYLESCDPKNCSCCDNRALIDTFPPGVLAADSFVLPRAVGANLQAAGPVWDLNVFLMNSSRAMDQISFLNQTVGAERVQMLELGNEFYLNPYRWRLPTVASYVENFKPTLERARQVFPGARVAAVASQIRESDGCGNSWNTELAPTVRAEGLDVTMHDYSLGNATVEKTEGEWQKLAFVLAYTDVVMSKAATGARKCFGDDVSIWQTEYNYAASTGAGFNHKHGPLFGDLLNGTLHGAYLASRMLYAVADPIYKSVNFMCALGVEQIGWGRTAGIVGLDIDMDAKPMPKVRAANVTGMAQIYAHLAYLAAPSEGAVTMAGLVQAGSAPSLNVTVAGMDGLPCLRGAAFFGSTASQGTGPASYGVALVNRCPDAATITLPSPPSSSASYAGKLAVYDARDPGGSVPLPSASEPLPWASGPLSRTTTVSVGGAWPATVTIPGLSMVMGKLQKQ